MKTPEVAMKATHISRGDTKVAKTHCAHIAHSISDFTESAYYALVAFFVALSLLLFSLLHLRCKAFIRWRIS